MESGQKKYGLIVPKQKLDSVRKTNNVFGDDSDSGDEAIHKKPIETSNQTKAQQRSNKVLINKALEEDATVFQYDEVFDDMKKKKELLDGNKTKADKKPRYIQNLIIQADKRKIEYERRNERLIQKERETEGNEFEDKEAFITSSYKKKLEELKKLDEEDLKFSMIEEINDVTKQKDMGSFYRHLYKSEFSNNKNDDKINEVNKVSRKSDVTRHYRKRESSNSSEDHNENDDKDTDISDDSESSGHSSTKRKKIENRETTSEEKTTNNSKEGNLGEKPLIIENPQANLEDKTSNDENDLKEHKDKDRSVNKKIEEKDSKPKEIVPKVNIWEKRTVGDVYESARQRYLERKMKKNNLYNR
ncbi:Domain of unknown function DUF2040 [Cinara cedri]|uniref:Nuclear speckle splicing regulatory protein 1 N-terminal domain-containing protein n=1 Tax=Cinara cedri TaxID=506608 RepID=A0A5E4NL37_9HEMI|nr:Domain of unknown function DUF2040 [Cinara cedri]